MQSVSAAKNRADTGLHQVPNFTSHLSTSDWMWWAGGSNGVKVNCEVFGSRCVRSVPPACRTCIFVSFHTGRLLPGSYVRLRPWERLVPADRELPVRAGFNRRGADIQTSRHPGIRPVSPLPCSSGSDSTHEGQRCDGTERYRAPATSETTFCIAASVKWRN